VQRAQHPLRWFLVVSGVLSLACVPGVPTEEDRSSRGSSRNDDDTALDSGSNDTGGGTDTSGGGTDTGGGGGGGGDTGGGGGGTDTGTTSPDADRDGWTVAEGDCNDRSAGTNPDMSEACDGADNNCNGAVDEGGACASDTVRVRGALAGSFRASASSYTSGTYGVAFLNESGTEVCRIVGNMSRQSTAAPSGCPQCDWSFNLSTPTGFAATGTGCSGLADQGYDASWAASSTTPATSDWSWGFSDSYTSGSSVVATNVIWYATGTSWYAMGYEPGGGSYTYGTTYFDVTGSTSNFSWHRGMDAYYYYYP
jgi:hypothetical protein